MGDRCSDNHRSGGGMAGLTEKKALVEQYL
jgi:hypothetical protein